MMALVLCLGYLTAASTSAMLDVEDREPDLGKRAYRYLNEYKRLPMYDFGLGKRAMLYNFGLGKRDDLDNYDNYMDDGEHIPETEMYDDEVMQQVDKRHNGIYSFGLGKRPLYEFGLGKRARQYEFGLGKRVSRITGSENETAIMDNVQAKRSPRQYSFGLGKREQDTESLVEAAVFPRPYRRPAYSFGLGKRRHMYSFGLGKRNIQP